MTDITIQWLEIDPLDTLFLRGTESMAAGENHEAQTMFPPMPATIIGAIRTALLGQQGILPAQYLEDPEKWLEQYPQLGTPGKPGFSLVGPLLTLGSIPLFPAPAHWMAAVENEIEDGQEVLVQAGEVLADTLLGLCGSVAKPFWTMRPTAPDMKPLAGYWVTASCFRRVSLSRGTLILRRDLQNIDMADAALIPLSVLLQREERVGIALSKYRTVKEGHLYTIEHIRLVSGVKFLVGMASEYPCSLQIAGVLQLGGEQRICGYNLVRSPQFPRVEEGKYYYLLSPLPAHLPESLNTMPRASGKLLRVGGWDMEKEFHKPLSAWFPAGTVIQKNTEQPDSGQLLPACISI